MEAGARFTANPDEEKWLLTDLLFRSGRPRWRDLRKGAVEEIVQFLVERGFDAGAPGRYGYRPLHLSLQWPEPAPLIRLLVAAGANVDGECPADGSTPLSYAVDPGWRDDHRCDLGAVRELIRLGADVNARDKSGRTVLHAANTARPEIFRELLAAGADPNASHLGSSVLHEATYDLNVEVVRTLVAFGADPHLKNDEDETAAEYIESDLVALRKWLAEKAEGAEPEEVVKAKAELASLEEINRIFLRFKDRAATPKR